MPPKEQGSSPLFNKLSGLKVVVAEDNGPMRNLFVAMLKGAGISDVRTATTATEALEILGAFAPDILTVDFRLRGMDGPTLVRRLKERDQCHNRNPYIIMVSGSNQTEHVVAAYEAGADVFLTKPVSTRILIDSIEALFGESSGTLSS